METLNEIMAYINKDKNYSKKSINEKRQIAVAMMDGYILLLKDSKNPKIKNIPLTYSYREVKHFIGITEEDNYYKNKTNREKHLFVIAMTKGYLLALKSLKPYPRPYMV